MMHSSSTRQGSSVSGKLGFVLAHLLLIALAIRPLHVHELRPSSHQASVSAESLGAAFCFDCTFGPDQIIVTAILALMTSSLWVALQNATRARVASFEFLRVASRGPPRR